MTPEQTAAIVDLIDLLSDTSSSLPVSQSDYDSFSIAEAASRQHLELNLVHPPPPEILQVRAPFDCYVAEPEEVGIDQTTPTLVLRLDLKPQFALMSSFEYVVLSPVAPDAPSGLILAGTTVGAAMESTLKVEFVRRTNDNSEVRFIPPAVALRLLGLLNNEYLSVLRAFIEADAPPGPGGDRYFHQEQIISAYDEETEGGRVLLGAALENEKDLLDELELPLSTDLQSRIVVPHVDSITFPTLRDTFDTLVENDANKFILRFIDGMNLYVAIFRAQYYEIDLIELSPQIARNFSILTTTLPDTKLIINGPFYSIFTCAKSLSIIRAAKYGVGFVVQATGMTKGHIKLRDGVLADADCPGAANRFYFYENGPGSFSFGPGFLPATEPMTVGFDNVPAIILDGVPLYDDSEYIEFQGKAKTQGMPFFGWLEKNGVKYYIVAMRKDTMTLTSYTEAATASFDQIVQSLVELGAIDVIWTDGDDSVGLICDGELHIEPGWKKVHSMPLAIGFRKWI